MGDRTRAWLVLLGLLAATPALGLPKWCALLNRAMNGYKYHSISADDWALRYGSQYETPAAAAYRERYVTAPAEGHEARRLEILRRTNQLPKGAPTEPEPARIVRTADTPKQHGGGGVYTRDYDQYGDAYGRGVEGPGTYPELSRYFNVPQYSPHLPEGEARFLRDGERNFPRTGLTAQDYRDLEPLPQTDPLKSYLGCNLVRLFGLDGDKPLPKYNPVPEGEYPTNKNYFRRGDGTYYIYDFPPGHVGWWAFGKTSVRDNETMQDGMRNIVDALATIKNPAERAKAIEFYVDSIFQFPQAGRERAAKLQRESVEIAKAYAADLATFQGDKKSLAFRLVAGALGDASSAHGPQLIERFSGPAGELEGYFAFPLMMLAYHKQRGHDRSYPDVVAALEGRMEAYRLEMANLPAEFSGAPEDLVRAMTNIAKETAKR